MEQKKWLLNYIFKACNVSSDERATDVDHIIAKNKGGVRGVIPEKQSY